MTLGKIRINMRSWQTWSIMRSKAQVTMLKAKRIELKLLCGYVILFRVNTHIYIYIILQYSKLCRLMQLPCQAMVVRGNTFKRHIRTKLCGMNSILGLHQRLGKILLKCMP